MHKRTRNGMPTLNKPPIIRRNKGGRPLADSVTIQLTTTPALCKVLDRVVETGFFGTSRAAAAERLLAEAIRGLLREGTIQKRDKALEV